MADLGNASLQELSTALHCSLVWRYLQKSACKILSFQTYSVREPHCMMPMEFFGTSLPWNMIQVNLGHWKCLNYIHYAALLTFILWCDIFWITSIENSWRNIIFSSKLNRNSGNLAPYCKHQEIMLTRRSRLWGNCYEDFPHFSLDFGPKEGWIKYVAIPSPQEPKILLDPFAPKVKTLLHSNGPDFLVYIRIWLLVVKVSTSSFTFNHFCFKSFPLTLLALFLGFLGILP